MSTKKKILLGVVGALVALLAILLALPSVAPLYLWVPHAPRDTTELFGDRPVVIAHRGWSAVAPENTLSAFRRAAELGVGYELDVGLCATGEAVVLHDDNLDRTTDGEGSLSSATIEQLRTLDAGGWFAPEFVGEPLPTLADVLSELGGTTVIDIELKTTDDKAALARAVVADVQAAGLQDRVFVTSFDPFLLEQVRLADPRLIRGQLVGDYKGSDLAWYERLLLQNLAFNGAVQPDLIVAQHNWITPEWTRWLQSQGYRVIVWTVNDDLDLDRALSMGADGVITDVPDRALARASQP